MNRATAQAGISALCVPGVRYELPPGLLAMMLPPAPEWSQGVFEVLELSWSP